MRNTMIEYNKTRKIRENLIKPFDVLITGIFIFLLLLIISGGFSFTVGTNTISAHDTENPSLVFVALLIIRQLICFKLIPEDIPLVRNLYGLLKKVHAHNSRRSPILFLAAMIGGYVILMSFVAVKKHLSYHSGFDLGIFDQVLWNILHNNGAVTSILGDRHFFGEHFSPILYLLTPLYFIYTDPKILLIFQTIALASGAIPVYALARNKLKSQQLALLFAFLYLCYQPLRNVNVAEFHPVALTTPLLLFAFYSLDRRKYLPFGICLVLALLCKEEIAEIVCILGIYLAYVQKKKWGIALALSGIAIFVIDIFVIIPHYRGAPFGFVHRYQYLGDNIPDMLKTLVFHPFYVIRHVLLPKKIAYIIQVFGPLGFLSVFSPAHLLLTTPTICQNMLSDSGVQYSIAFQYTSPLTPFIFISAICGLHNIFTRQTLRRRLQLARYEHSQIIHGVSVALLMLCVLFFGKSPSSQLRQYKIAEHTMLADTFVNSIPDSASVSSQYAFLPHLSHRTSLYQFPVINDAEYVLLDDSSDTWPLSQNEYHQAVSELLQNENFETMKSQEGLILLKKKSP